MNVSNPWTPTAAANAFSAMRYQLRFVVDKPIRLPEFAGSALRGAFGHALRRLACVTRQRHCPSCPLYRTCPYPAVFETPPPQDSKRVFSQIPNPFVVEPPSWGPRILREGDELRFSLVLIGQALQQLPLVVLALERALAGGIGPAEGTAQLVTVHAESEDEPIYEAPSGQLRSHGRLLPPPPSAAAVETVTLAFDTPLRIQREGHVLGVRKLSPADLLTTLVRRVALLCEFHLGTPLVADFTALKRAAAAIEGEKDLEWRDWTRYSARQDQAMTLGGAVGTWTLHGDLAPFLPFLHLGQWLHVGKNASFGLGRYRSLPSKDDEPIAGHGLN
jgi:hypothetical protein